MQILLGRGREPPKELRIWPFGRIATSKGTFLFDRKAASEVMRAYRTHGNQLCFDYEHKSIAHDTRAGDGKAAGWFAIELRKDGLWAVDIRWTDKAAAEISAREWRYWSPTFECDHKTGRISALVNVALTNIPATHRLQPLVAASRKGQMDPKEDEKFCEDSAADKQEDCEDDAKAEKLAKIKALRAELAALEADAGETEEMADSEDEDEGDDDPEAEPVAKLSLLDVARKVTGLAKADSETLAGALVALSEQAKAAEAARKKLAQVTGNARKTMVDKAIASGQLEPSKRAWALSQSESVLKGYLAISPKRSIGTAAHEEPQDVALSDGSQAFIVGGRTITLSAQELDGCRRMGNDPAKYAAHKAGIRG